MEELYEGLTKFVNENPKAFESTEQWLGQFDGDYDAAWEDAQADLTPDWKKIVFVTVKTLENGIEFMLNRILAGEYMTSEHPNLGRIRKALEQGKKAVLLDENKAKSFSLDDLEHPVKCTVVAEIVRGMSHNIAAKLKRHQYPVVKVARHNYCEVEHAAILYPKKRKALEKHRKDAEE